MLSVYSLLLTAICASQITLCFARKPIEVEGKTESLFGITVSGETVLNIVKLHLPGLAVDVILPNATEVNVRGVTPSFSTAVCKSKNLFIVAISDILKPRVLAVDIVHKKVIGTMHVNGILIDNLECDDQGNGFAYVFQLGSKHTIIKIDFNTMLYTKLMHSSYKSYGGSSIDSKNKRFFTVADTPFYDSFNYSISVIEYGNSKEYITLPFKHYSIGGLVYEPSLEKLFGFVETPAGLQEGVKYSTYLAELDLKAGIVHHIAGPWERVTLIEESALTLDPSAHMVYVLTEEKIRKVDVQNKRVVFEKPTAAVPWPTKCYEYIKL